MTKKYTFACIISLILSLSACNVQTDKAPASDLSAPLDSLFTELFPSPDEPGAVVLVAKGDSIIFNRSYGMANMKRNIPLTDSTLLNICSISKQFSAVALLKLQEEGLISLDDSVTKYFPKFPGRIFNKITLRHLLSHTSGIPDARPRTRDQWNDYVRKHDTKFGNERDFALYGLSREETRYMETLDWLDFKPGTAYKYQNPTFVLAQHIIEQATGKAFLDYMDSTIFIPAGMTTTQYLNPDIQQPQLAHAYKLVDGPNRYGYWRSDDDKWEECDYGEALFFPTKADGGLYTSALEFLKYEKALFGGKIISNYSLLQATTPVIATDEPLTSYGLGLFIEERPDRPRKIYHTGDNGGFLCVEAYFPEKDIFYLIFANQPHWDREATIEKTDSILAAKKLI